ncbi:hypothetical protein, partial [Lishizhenia sp.]|uniref:hypothetical protein n=1 Tax=Lishizhenia sp. TaxID=2497594 RepID=UPI00299D007E
MIKKNVLYIGNFIFPNGNASGLRVLGNGYLLRSIGHEVYFVGMKEGGDFSLSTEKKTYDKFNYYEIGRPNGIKDWLSYGHVLDSVKDLIEQLDIDVIITYGSPTLTTFVRSLQKWAKKNSIILYTDCVDWLPSNNGNLIHRAIKWVDDSYQKRVVNLKGNGVIVISSYLRKYYEERGCRIVTIPPLVNSKSLKLRLNDTKNNKLEKTKLVYVGIPFALDGRI